MKPILFNAEMVRALLEGRKTVTRRVVKQVENNWDFIGVEERPYECRVAKDGTEYPKELDWPHAIFSAGSGYCDFPMRKFPHRSGDILYVRETWAPFYETMQSTPVIGYRYYAETDEEIKARLPEYLNWFWPGRWYPSIHMPREAARIFLRVTDVSVERLQSIIEGDAKKEGFVNDIDLAGGAGKSAARHFADSWNSTIKPADRALYGWDANPWVWRIAFERISKEEAAP